MNDRVRIFRIFRKIRKVKNLEGGRQVVFEEPELDGRLGVLEDAQHHDADETLVEVARSQREDVELVVLVVDGFRGEGRRDRVPQTVVVLIVRREEIHLLLPALLVHFQLEHVRFERADEHLDVGAVARSVGAVVRADVVDLRRAAVPQSQDPRSRIGLLFQFVKNH